MRIEVFDVEGNSLFSYMSLVIPTEGSNIVEAHEYIVRKVRYLIDDGGCHTVSVTVVPHEVLGGC